MEVSKNISIVIYLNSDLGKKIKIAYCREISLSVLKSICNEKFKLHSANKCILYDSRGEALSEDDMDYINPDEPLFFSIGEDFSPDIILALYEKIKTLGQGGFGTVKLYRHRIHKSFVAIKFIKTNKLLKPESISRAYKEIQLLRDLNHPNIVKLIDVFPISNQICFVMEYCQGGELKKYVRDQGGLNEDEVVSLSLQLCDAVRYCHNSKVIHRDLKPENIMFKDKARTQLVIVDFGIAGIFSIGNSGEKSGAGSLFYLAPEVINETNQSACPELDIWSLGCIIYFLLTGERPFNGKTRREVVDSIVKGKISKLSYFKPCWKLILMNTLQIVPSSRWSLLKLISVLYKIKENEPLEESKSHNVTEYVAKSASLRSIRTPEPTVKLPNIARKRIVTRPRK